MAKAKKADKKQVAPWMYDIIREPHVTEKATMGSEHGQMTFKVPMTATKPQIRQAIETIWGVKVTGVNTLIQKGKTKRFRGHKGQRPDTKKAVVTLKEGDSIDVGIGV